MKNEEINIWLRLPKTLPVRRKKKKSNGELKEITKNIERELSTQKRFCFANALLPLGTAWESPRTLNTFANHTYRPTVQNLQKSAIFAEPLKTTTKNDNMKIIRKLNINQDYYSQENSGKFFSIKLLQNPIVKDSLNIDLLNAAIFHFTNNERNKFRIPICQFHSVLRDSSIIHSSQMKLLDFFSHDNPYNPNYRTLKDRVDSIKEENNQFFSSIGENISDYPILKSNESQFVVKSFLNTQRYYSIDGMKEIHPFTYEEFATEVVNGWMNSEGHKRNILNCQFKYLGCGAVLYEKRNNYLSPSIIHFKITQNFGGEFTQKKQSIISDKTIKIFKKQ